MECVEPKKLRLAAVGDLLLPAGVDGLGEGRDLAVALAQVRGVLGEADVVLGNLEFALPGDGAMVPTEPRVISSPRMVRALAAEGFDAVSLSNNHTFDCYEPGYRRLRGLLDELGIGHFGAGEDLDEAAQPLVIERAGLRVAMLSVADERSGTTCFAGPRQAGVAPMDMPDLATRVTRLRERFDHVVVSVHWGEERMLIPSPVQIAHARELVQAGATLILGHHPHVVQGMEWHRGAPIVYSLGNFLAEEVPFVNGDHIRWGHAGRIGCVLVAELGPDGHVGQVRQVGTYDDGQALAVDPPRARRRIARCNRAIARGVTLRRYRREHLRVHTLRPILSYLHPRRLVSLRWRHVRKTFQLLGAALRAR